MSKRMTENEWSHTVSKKSTLICMIEEKHSTAGSVRRLSLRRDNTASQPHARSCGCWRLSQDPMLRYSCETEGNSDFKQYAQQLGLLVEEWS